MALTDNIVAYYKLDESSGNASDSVGNNTLTNNNTVGYSAAKINNGADFGTTNTNKNLEVLSNVGITGSAVSINLIVKLKTEISSGTYTLCHLSTGSTNYRGFYIDYSYNAGTRRVGFAMNREGIEEFRFTSNITLGTTDFFFLTLTYDGTNIIGYINGTSVGTIAASGIGDSGYSHPCVSLSCYRDANSQARGNYSSVILDEVGIWSRALSSTEVTELYNSGNGKQYPFSLAYTLAVELGQYTYTGVNFLFKLALKMAVTTGSYTYTGIDYLFKLGKGMTITTGSYVYTGVNFTLKSARTMAITTGDYVYTGIDFLFQKGFGMVISTGQYIYTGINFILRSSNIWTNQSKNSSTFTNQSKNSSDWNFLNKN